MWSAGHDGGGAGGRVGRACGRARGRPDMTRVCGREGLREREKDGSEL